MNADELNRISERIIGCAFAVANTLGVGFLEKVYENALAHELRKSGLVIAQQHPVTVIYDGVSVGNYTVDLFVATVRDGRAEGGGVIGREPPSPVPQLSGGDRRTALSVDQLRKAADRDQATRALTIAARIGVCEHRCSGGYLRTEPPRSSQIICIDLRLFCTWIQERIWNADKQGCTQISTDERRGSGSNPTPETWK
jgi:PD-(D/E)XK nuclease superfamily